VFDDQKLAYPMWEKARKLGLKNIGCHKGIPSASSWPCYAHPEDLDAVCDDFPDLNFIAYHSAWPYQHELAALKGFKPQRKNLYAEVGSTFAATVTNRRSSARTCSARCSGDLRPRLRDVGHRLGAVGESAVARSTPSGSSGSPTSSSRGTAIRRSPTSSRPRSSV